MITFQSESLALIRPELEPLMVRHWEEVCHDKEFFRLNPSWDSFKTLEDAGLVVTITARTEQSQLVGYVVYVLSPLLHYNQIRMAQEDAHYLAPEYRKGWTAARMFRFAENELRVHGLHATVIHTKAHKELDRGALFQRLGYQRHETLYIKRL